MRHFRQTFIRGNSMSSQLMLIVALLGASTATSTRATESLASTAEAQDTYKIGDRVEWTIGGISFPGTIYSAQGGKYQIERDGYGRASEWVTVAELRRLPGTSPVAAPQPPAQPAPRGQQPMPPADGQGIYKTGDRVEWTIGGITYASTVYNAQSGKYQVERDGYGRTADWVTAADLRRIPGTLPVAAQPEPQPTDNTQSFEIGDRVEWNIGDIWYPGIVYSARGGRYQINRDQFGRARESETDADLRHFIQAKVEQPLTGAAARGPFKNGERVEVTINGAWLRGNIGVADIDNDRYVVDRENPAGNNRREAPVSSAQIRRITFATTRVAGPPLPGAIPTGEYECQMYLSGAGVVGRLRILDGSSYSGLSTSGTGAKGRYAFDQASGNISWVGGLQGFRYPLTSSSLARANNTGAPFILINYQLRAGGNINSMSCVRKG
jgi:hypothetical protein